MKAFLYRAALLCADCGERQRAKIAARGEAPADPDNESSYDSDKFPKGPYDNGGGEADRPQHCDHCATFLGNPLTPEGDAYVRGAASVFDAPDSSWAEIAARARHNRQISLAEWIEFYFAPGM